MYVKPFNVGKLHDHAVVVDFKLPSQNDKCAILLTADHHFDNPMCIRTILQRDHENALENNMMICAFGDIFCAMQGKMDRRHSKSSVLPENQVNNYYGSLVKEAADFYSKYAHNYIMMSPGNHETGVLKKVEYDLIDGLVERINLQEGSNIQQGLYRGWILIRLWRKGNSRKFPDHTIKLAYHHGYGGGGPVTKGTIQTNRRANYMPDADVIVTGHIHEKWTMSIVRERLDNRFNIVYDEQYHVQVPTYKEEYHKGKGWHTERGGPPKPLGGIIMEIRKEYFRGAQHYTPSFKPTFDMRYWSSAVKGL